MEKIKLSCQMPSSRLEASGWHLSIIFKRKLNMNKVKNLNIETFFIDNFWVEST